MSQGTSQDVVSDLSINVSTDVPAVGLLATADNANWIAGEVLRIHQAGHQTIVTAQSDDDPTGLQYAELLGARVIEPAADWTSSADAKQRIREVAREMGYPGLLYHTDSATQIDLETSVVALNATEGFALEAVPKSPVQRQPSVMVGIPAYNERGAIGGVVRDALQYADVVLVVDDGSVDGTAEIAEDAGAEVVRHQKNSGYGAALKSIFKQASHAEADHLVIIDADGQHDASDIPKLVRRQQETGAELIIGCRFGGDAETKMPLYRRFGLGVVNLLTNLSMAAIRPSDRITDTQSGFRAYNREAIESLAADDSIGNSMDASTDILFHAHSKGYSHEEIPTTIRYDEGDTNSKSPVEHGFILVKNIVRMVERERPITLFGIPGMLCLLLGFGVGYGALFNYLQTGTFPLGWALFATFLAISGMLAVFTAIILHSLALYHD